MEKEKLSYPMGCSNDELKGLINKYASESENSHLGPSYFSKAALGLVELHSRQNSIIAKWTSGVAILALGVSLYGLWLTNKQTDYAEVESRADRIFQAQSIKNAVEKCQSSPEIKESGLFDPSDGKQATCPEVLRIYSRE